MSNWGWGLRLGSGGVVILAPGPTNTVAPVASGTAELGELLSCTSGTWTGEGVLSYAYQWLRDGASIAAATANTYTLVEADVGALISCRVTATDDNGSRSRVSNSLGPVVDPLALDALLLTESGDELLLTEGGDPLILTEAA